MKLVWDGALSRVPRPFIWRDWQWRTMEIGVGIGSATTDELVYVGVRHELSDRQLELIDRFWVRPREGRSAAVVIHDHEEFERLYGKAS